MGKFGALPSMFERHRRVPALSVKAPLFFCRAGCPLPCPCRSACSLLMSWKPGKDSFIPFRNGGQRPEAESLSRIATSRSHREAARERPLLARERRAAGWFQEGVPLEPLPGEAKALDGLELPSPRCLISRWRNSSR